MKILVLAPQPFYSGRGTPIAVRALVEVLAEGGHEVHLLTYFEGEEVPLAGAVVHRIRRPPFVRRVPIGPSWQKVPCNLFMLAQARRMLRDGRYDVMHGVEDGALLAAVLSAATGVPYVFDMDSHMSAQIFEKSALLWPISLLFGLAEKVALRRASGVLAVCPALVDLARQHQERVAYLPDMPFAQEPASPCAEITAIGGVRVLYVGNLETYQGIDVLLSAFRAASEGYPEARLVIVGGSAERIAAYAAACSDLVDAGKVRFLGDRPIEQLGSILAASDIVASPRLTGINTPMKIYSYLASGRPMLATRLPTHTQVVPEDAALLVDPVPESMADGLATLLHDSELRQRLGRRGRELVRAEFSRVKFAARLSTFYDQIEKEVLKRQNGDALMPQSR